MANYREVGYSNLVDFSGIVHAVYQKQAAAKQAQVRAEELRQKQDDYYADTWAKINKANEKAAAKQAAAEQRKANAAEAAQRQSERTDAINRQTDSINKLNELFESSQVSQTDAMKLLANSVICGTPPVVGMPSQPHAQSAQSWANPMVRRGKSLYDGMQVQHHRGGF